MIETGYDAPTHTYWVRCIEHDIEQTWIPTIAAALEVYTIHREHAHG